MNPQPLMPRQAVPALDVPTIDGGRFILGAAPAEKFDLVVFYRGLHCGVVARMLGCGLLGSSALIKTADQPHAQQTQHQVPPPYSEDEVFGAQLG